jgi:rhodanese-related sulfurtransferase
MSLNEAFLPQAEQRVGRGDRIIVGCQRGGRSLKAAELLAASGFSQVADMRGGFDGELDASGRCVFPGWTRCGLPVEE